MKAGWGQWGLLHQSPLTASLNPWVCSGDFSGADSHQKCLVEIMKSKHSLPREIPVPVASLKAWRLLYWGLSWRGRCTISGFSQQSSWLAGGFPALFPVSDQPWGRWEGGRKACLRALFLSHFLHMIFSYAPTPASYYSGVCRKDLEASRKKPTVKIRR